MNIIRAWQVLKKGNELKDVTKWKNFQLTTTIVGGVLSAICYLLPLFGIDIVISEEMLTNIAEGIAAILLTINLYFTAATTKKTGLGKMPEEIMNEEVKLTKKEPGIGIGD